MNKKNDLVRKNYIDFFIKITIWTLVFPITLLFLIVIYKSFDFQWLYNISPNIYIFLKIFLNNIIDGSFGIFIFIIWFSGFSIILYMMIKKIFSYVDAISKASENLLNKDVLYINLPRELEDFQIKINSLKKEALKNERLARENEQKKNDLIVYLAHDLKTPLTSMIGYLSLLDEIKDMPKAKKEKYVSIALDKSYKLESLINELFDIARFNSETVTLEKEEINLNLMFEQLIDDFYPMLKEHNKEIKLKNKNKTVIFGDSFKLARVFGNLIKNAIIYSKEHFINIDIYDNDNLVTVVVSNKGKKIPEEKLNKIFEKFYRIDQSRMSKTGGSGLGLAIAKEIVELHGGQIKATSDNKTTNIYVTLPKK